MKRFDQYCPIAHALSLVGERWSLLVVRELLHGPKRYTDLAHGLPGIGTNILAARLRDLEGAGVIEKRKLPPPTPVTVYELTEYGKGLNEAMYALARWGARTLGPPKEDDELYPEWGVNAFTARIVDGELEANVGAADDADLVLDTDMETFFRLALGELDPREAVVRDCARIEGDIATLKRCFRVLSLAPRVSAVV